MYGFMLRYLLLVGYVNNYDFDDMNFKCYEWE